MFYLGQKQLESVTHSFLKSLVVNTLVTVCPVMHQAQAFKTSGSTFPHTWSLYMVKLCAVCAQCRVCDNTEQLVQRTIPVDSLKDTSS